MVPAASRPDLAELAGYHSAQVEVEVRLNTNESPIAPPAAWLEDFRSRSRATSQFNRYPDRSATELRRALADSHGVAAEQVFCANGSNEVLQSLLLAYGGPGPHRGRCSSRPTPSTATSPASPAPGWPPASGPTTSASTSTRCAECVDDRATGHHVPLLAQQPDGPGRPRRAMVEAVLALAPAWSWSTRPTASSPPSSALELVGGRAGAALVVVRTFSKTWSLAGLRLGYLVGRARRGRRPASWWPCPTTSTPPSSWPGAWPCVRRRDGGAGGRWSTRSGAGSPPPWPPSRRDLAVRRQLHPVPPASTPAREVWQACSTARCWCETVRRGRGSPAACGSRSGLPRRTTASWPR